MKVFSKTLLLLVILTVVFQFVQPTKNKSEGISSDDISKVYAMDEELHGIFVTKCYDCHSNNTKYPWYFNVQPIGWWLAAHVHDGKEHLNFSAFGSYSREDAEHKLEELKEVMEDHSMPLKSYVLFHPETEVTEADIDAVNAWLRSIGAIDE